MTEPTWLADLRTRVAVDGQLRKQLLVHANAAEFAQAVAVVAGITVEEVELAMQNARRKWLERWIS